MKKLFLVLFFLLCFSICMEVKAHQPHDCVDAIAVSPAFESDQTVFCTLTHINNFLLKTSDGGLTWRPSQIGLPHTYITSIALSPAFASDGVAFVGTKSGSVYKSMDRGVSWKLLGTARHEIISLSVSPCFASDQTLFAGLGGGGVFKSSDGGLTWTSCCKRGFIYDLAISHSFETDETLFAGTKDGVFKSTDGGLSWSRLNYQHVPVTSLSLSAGYSSDRTLFAGVWGLGVFKSEDGGNTWESRNNGITDLFIADVAVSPEFPDDQTLLVATKAEGVFISTSGGAAWTPMKEGLDELAVQTDTHYFQLGFSPNYAQDRIVFLASFEGVHKSEDSMARWRHLDVYHQKFVRALDISPDYANDGTVYASSYGGGVYQSKNRGDNWIAVDTGLSNLFHAEIKVSPAYSQDKTVFAGKVFGVEKSTLGGDFWTKIDPDPGNWSYIRALVLSPDYAVDQTLFLGNNHKYGIYPAYKSVDGGTSFAPLPSSELKNPFMMAISPAYSTDRTVFASGQTGVYRTQNGGTDWNLIGEFGTLTLALVVSPAFQSDGVVYAGTMNKGVYKSTDQGDTWLPANEGIGDLNIEAIGLSPAYQTDQILFAGTKSGGVFKSIDGGATWKYVGLQGEFIRRLSVSPDYPADQTVFLGTWSGIHRTQDGGSSWEQVLNIHRYDDTGEFVIYQGAWKSINNSFASGSHMACSAEAQACCSMNFTGNSVSWIGAKIEYGGIAGVDVDGLFQTYVDLYSPTIQLQRALFTKTGLGSGAHNITVTVTGEKNSASSWKAVFVDAFEVED